ncbi:hypothetical protein [Streptomyces sp. NBC_01708]|uniref:hypothetical protein n=1 Tax=Streptomyces sp. NBC_01708 TaxID=2975915 RepID=UPI002E2FEF2E|nr:hypothetical protein [Streptomyces sp. NBC_01708]
MAFTLFTRRPASVAPTEEPVPASLPEIGETWDPEGVTVVERYYNQVHAVVLVYKAQDRYVVACLGCHFAKAVDRSKGYTWLTFEDAAEVANAHATTCRAMSRRVPARPDDDTVRERLRKWVGESRNRVKDVELRIEALDPARLTLQRTDDWIEARLRELADAEPDLLLVKSWNSGRLRFFAQAASRS